MRIFKVSNPSNSIPLGRQGENLALQVQFPIACWVEEYGEGTFQLVYQRPGEDTPYPVEITSDGETVSWHVTATDTALAGVGRAELLYYVGDVLAKSCIYATRIIESLDGAGDPPEPSETWLNQVLEASAKAEAAAETAVHQPVIGANGNWWVWNADAGEYADTGTPASGGGGASVNWGSGLKYDAPTATVSVDTSDMVQPGDTRPVTSAAVQVEIGNIDVLLQTI